MNNYTIESDIELPEREVIYSYEWAYLGYSLNSEQSCIVDPQLAKRCLQAYYAFICCEYVNVADLILALASSNFFLLRWILFAFLSTLHWLLFRLLRDLCPICLLRFTKSLAHSL